MKGKAVAYIAVIGAAALIAAAGRTEARGWQDQQGGQTANVASGDSPTQAAARLSSQWKLNKDLSTGIGDSAAGEPGTGSGAPGGTGGGGTGGRRPGGRRGGGGAGGYGGRGGRSGGNQEQQLAARGLLREVSEPPDVLNIVASATDVSFTDSEGTVRRFTISGKKESTDLGTAKVDARTSWSAGALTQELETGQLKVTRTYEVTVEGHQMLVTVSVQGGARLAGPGSAAPMKFVYDRVPSSGI